MSIFSRLVPFELSDLDANCRQVQTLLSDLGIACLHQGQPGDEHPARSWADSGLMYLVGDEGSAPAVCPVTLASRADACLAVFRRIAGTDALPGTRGSQLLSERAAITGSRRRGAVSPGGSCRLLPSADGRIGLNLARPEDWELVPAWLQDHGVADWHSIADRLTTRESQHLVQRGRLLGLAVADATGIPTEKTPWFELRHEAGPAPARRPAPRVLDLSSLWAGPLCSRLWQQAGAEVIKIESTTRPDGARSGSPRFFDLLNHGKRELALELHTPEGRRALLDLMQQADIVLEGSRPRALRQMGIIAEDLLDANPGLSWISITGYGRGQPQENWIAYGDDAGIAAGLSAILHQATGNWWICGDAIADPLTGLHAALAGWASWLAGGGHLIELSLEQTVRHCITAAPPRDNDYRERQARWMRYLQDNRIEPRAPLPGSEAEPSAP